MFLSSAPQLISCPRPSLTYVVADQTSGNIQVCTNKLEGEHSEIHSSIQIDMSNKVISSCNSKFNKYPCNSVMLRKSSFGLKSCL